MQCELFDPQLGTLVLGCDPYVVTSLQVGSPEVRDVTRNRSLGDGTLDDTRYLGSRAITMAIRFNDTSLCAGHLSMQTLIDQLVPYMSPRRRPTLSWELPGSEQYRSAIVRGVNWGWTFDTPKANSIAPQWVVPSGEILLGGPAARQCTTIKPSTDVEVGRGYDLLFDRTYPPSAPVGGRTINNWGTSDAHWTLTFYGPVVNPHFTINGILFAVDRRGGVSVAVGQTLVVDTRSRTVLLNNVPDDSRYQNCNYEDWGWDELMLHPNNNNVRFEGTGMTEQSAAELCYTPTYL